MQDVIFRDLGRMDYRQAWDYQEALLQENVRIKSEWRNREPTIGNAGDRGFGVSQSGDTPPAPATTHFLLFVEHPSVYTLGKSGHEENLLTHPSTLEQQGISLFRANRGGDITFHGPGQIVGYPILDLERFYTDIGKYLRNLEETVILTLAEYGIHGERSPGETGVWIDPTVKGRERKICAIGIRCSRWITMHGFAFNINTDLSHFSQIIPCGIPDKQATSLQNELGREIPLEEVKQKLERNFEIVFDVRLIN
ncbi:MAG: lipoyl(octanoyl) transferase LipB [Puia sp.]|nr:lipoyl(octanoyl) transferase LipB [Puia sp.]